MRQILVPLVLLIMGLTLASCGGSKATGTVTLRAEVTSSGRSLQWFGSAHIRSISHFPHDADTVTSDVALSGSTPFSKELSLTFKLCGAFGCDFDAEVQATKSAGGPEILTLCVTMLDSGRRACATSVPPCRNDSLSSLPSPFPSSCDGRTASVSIKV